MAAKAKHRQSTAQSSSLDTCLVASSLLRRVKLGWEQSKWVIHILLLLPLLLDSLALFYETSLHIYGWRFREGINDFFQRTETCEQAIDEIVGNEFRTSLTTTSDWNIRILLLKVFYCQDVLTSGSTVFPINNPGGLSDRLDIPWVMYTLMRTTCSCHEQTVFVMKMSQVFDVSLDLELLNISSPSWSWRIILLDVRGDMHEISFL